MGVGFVALEKEPAELGGASNAPKNFGEMGTVQPALPEIR